MSHEWYKGVLTASSWHKLEQIGVMTDAEAMIRAGEQSQAWPVSTHLESMTTENGLAVPGKAVVGVYGNGSRIAHSAMSDKYRPLAIEEWRETIKAIVKAGGSPTGAFALRDGTRMLATFGINGNQAGIQSYLNVVDSLDGTLSFQCGGTSIRTVCANTLSASFSADGAKYARIRHTATINDRAAVMRNAIEAYLKEGETVRAQYLKAKETFLAKDDALEVFELLFPAPTAEQKKDERRKALRLQKTRNEAVKAAQLEVNSEGKGSLATLWNAATWLVDRTVDGEARKPRGGGDGLDSLLFGSRGKRIEEIRSIIRVVMKDGSEVEMEAPEAAAHGVDHAQIGRSLLEDML